jgi:hypothetical protein
MTGGSEVELEEDDFQTKTPKPSSTTTVPAAMAATITVLLPPCPPGTAEGG